MKIHPSSSREQTEGGEALVQALSSHLRIDLKEGPPDLGKRSEVDGYSEKPPILCEAWAHYGKPKGSQPNKVMTDAFKLIFIEKHKGKIYKKILLSVMKMHGNPLLAKVGKLNP